MEPSFEVIEITPELAGQWLGRKRPNRNVRQRDVEKIARDIKDGRWQFNGDAIRFGEDGLLDDGQHRLAAIVLAGIAVPSLVMHGLKADARHTVDTGLSRKYYDMLAMAGHTDASALASTTRRMWHWDKGLYVLHSASASVNPSIQELDDYLAEHNDELVNAVAWGRTVYKDCHVSPTVFATMAVILPRTKNGKKAQEFMSGWVSGASLETGNPILHLRRRLARIDQDRSARADHVTQEDRRGFACQAWNAWVAGKTFSSGGTGIYKPAGGFTNRNFPVPE
jgi:hypothetical protein